MELVKKTSSAANISSGEIVVSVTTMPVSFSFVRMNLRMIPAMQPSDSAGVKTEPFLIMKMLAIVLSQTLPKLFSMMASLHFLFLSN